MNRNFRRGYIRRTGRLIMAVMLLVFLFAGTGCGLLDRLMTAGDEGELTSAPVDIEISGDLVPEGETGMETKTVTLYFGHPDGVHLKAEQRIIPKVEGIARATMQELLSGTTDPELFQVIPAGTELNDINIRPDGTCVVDFSRELLNSGQNGPKEEQLAVYAIVNTLTEFPTVNQVEILIDGQLAESVTGSVDLLSPLYRDEYLIRD